MTTAPQPISSLQAAIKAKIDVAGDLLEKRLLPAVLDMKNSEARQKNSLVLNNFAISKGLVGRFSTMQPLEICDQLYNAVVADVQSERPQLVWTKAPKALLRRLESTKDPNARQDFHATEDLSKKMAEASKADARIREQEASKKRILGLIGAFCPTKRGVVKQALRDGLRKKWSSQLAETKDFLNLETKIREEQEIEYAKLERPEQVG